MYVLWMSGYIASPASRGPPRMQAREWEEAWHCGMCSTFLGFSMREVRMAWYLGRAVVAGCLEGRERGGEKEEECEGVRVGEGKGLEVGRGRGEKAKR